MRRDAWRPPGTTLRNSFWEFSWWLSSFSRWFTISSGISASAFNSSGIPSKKSVADAADIAVTREIQVKIPHFPLLTTKSDLEACYDDSFCSGGRFWNSSFLMAIRKLLLKKTNVCVCLDWIVHINTYSWENLLSFFCRKKHFFHITWFTFSIFIPLF